MAGHKDPKAVSLILSEKDYRVASLFGFPADGDEIAPPWPDSFPAAFHPTHYVDAWSQSAAAFICATNHYRRASLHE